MSIIITKTEKPVMCACCFMLDYCTDANLRNPEKLPDHCPLKSIDGLIKKIKDIDDEYQSKHGVFLSATGCIQIIKEYCEVSE